MPFPTRLLLTSLTPEVTRLALAACGDTPVTLTVRDLSASSAKTTQVLR